MSQLTFSINYHTNWGEQVCISGSAPELGNFNEDKALILEANGDNWSTIINIHTTTDLTYYYFIKKEDQPVRREWGPHRLIHIQKNRPKYILHDFWKNIPFHTYLYSSVFTDTIFTQPKPTLAKRYFKQTILLNVICPYVTTNQKLMMSGACDYLGGWELKLAKPLYSVGEGEWQIVLDASKLPLIAEYKFVIVDKKSGVAAHWEDGNNRVLHKVIADEENSLQAEMALLFQYRNYFYKGTGTAIPVFSLRSEDSFGIGDFADLRKLIDWVVVTRQQLIQLLPVNDTTVTKTWRDSYPYNASSAFALHPIYLGCSDYPLKDKKKWKNFLKEANELNRLSALDYEKVLSLKYRYCRALFQQDKKTILNSEDYNSFCNKNKSWLFPYVCYCYLRDTHNSSDFREWGKYDIYNEELLQEMVDHNPDAREETQFWSFLQYLLHLQFSGVKLYAHQKGIALKGDIPIGISRNSTDAWVAPELYNMDTQTGAAPDDFSIYGQNWGFPTYNWQKMAKDGYAWWVNRFRKMSDYFDAYRIDHILGFFRIWEIPLDAVQGSLGHFSPALPFTAEEIDQAGIPFDEERMLQPFIHENYLCDIFGEYTEEVKHQYLDIIGWERYQLKSNCNSQRKIEDLFENKHDGKSRLICEGLMQLRSEVLFVRDPRDFYRFHPRIAAHYTRSYGYLDDHVKETFNRLYDAFFYQRHDYFWREEAMKKLPILIGSTKMMVCGEDLGMVPDCVPSVMQELQMLSLEIERMPKKQNITFSDLYSIPYLSVCTTSTHDMSPLRLWWTENNELTQYYYNNTLGYAGDAPSVCNSEICRQIIERHLHSPAMWVILPLQDWFSIDNKLHHPDIASERINIPANSEHYWRYRMHVTLEKLLEESEFNENVAMLSKR